MAKEQQHTEAQAKKDNQPKADLTDRADPLGLSAGLLTSLLFASGDGSPAGQATQLADSRLKVVQRRSIASHIGQIQGNMHLQRIIASYELVRSNKETIHPNNTSTLQRALPLPESDLPQLGPEPAQGSLPPGQQLPDPLAAVTTYIRDGNVDNGQAAVNEAVRYLELRNAVQYTGQSDIIGRRRGRVRGTPEFSDVASGEANEASGYSLGSGESGFAFIYSTDPLQYKVEIYPRALIGGDANQRLAYLLGTLVHEYIHIQQFRRQVQRGEQETERSNARREFQAWLWQAEHVSELGLRGNVQGILEIYRNLRTYWSGLSNGDKRQLLSRVRSACRDNLGQDPAVFSV